MSSPRGDSYYQKARDGIFKNCDLSPLIMETNLGVATALFDPRRYCLKQIWLLVSRDLWKSSLKMQISQHNFCIISLSAPQKILWRLKIVIFYHVRPESLICTTKQDDKQPIQSFHVGVSLPPFPLPLPKMLRSVLKCQIYWQSEKSCHLAIFSH